LKKILELSGFISIDDEMRGRFTTFGSTGQWHFECDTDPLLPFADNPVVLSIMEKSLREEQLGELADLRRHIDRGASMESKYKMFRNFMANELQITREDIMQWTKESVAETVGKLIGQLNTDKLISDAVVEFLGSRMNVGYDSIKSYVRQMLAERFDIKVSMKE
jgi:hypothetical protein